MQFGLQVERKQFGALRIYDGDILRSEHVLKVAQFFLWDFVRVVHRQDEP